jgi:hypothetical protein
MIRMPGWLEKSIDSDRELDAVGFLVGAAKLEEDWIQGLMSDTAGEKPEL